MIFILFFGMTMRGFAWASMGSLREPSSDKNDFITQRLRKNRVFVKKKTIFLGVMQAVFDYATLFFIVFGPFFLA